MGSKLRAKFDQICRDHPFKALNDVVYEVLMEEIILFRLRPGAKITESRIAEELIVSRTVVAAAMDTLQAHELIIKEKSRSPHVALFTLEDYNNLMKIRNPIEAIAAEQMSQRATPDELKKLVRLAHDMEICFDAKDYEGFVKTDLKYHAFIVKCSGNTYLMHAYEQISPRIQQYMLIQAPKVIDENPSFKEEHHNMCAAIQRGNPEYAKLVATLHCSGLFLDAEQISSGLPTPLSGCRKRTLPGSESSGERLRFRWEPGAPGIFHRFQIQKRGAAVGSSPFLGFHAVSRGRGSGRGGGRGEGGEVIGRNACVPRR